MTKEYIYKSINQFLIWQAPWVHFNPYTYIYIYIYIFLRSQEHTLTYTSIFPGNLYIKSSGDRPQKYAQKYTYINVSTCSPQTPGTRLNLYIYSPGDRPQEYAPNILILMTDGRSSRSAAVAEANLARAAGITIIAIGKPWTSVEVLIC